MNLQDTFATPGIKLMTHVVAGFPDLEKSKELVRMMSQNGADVVEIQIPFSDPVADGPTMMQANERSLEQGTTVADCLQMIKELSAEIATPLLIMTYYNIVFKYGINQFCAAAAAAGVQGVIIPDYPIEMEEHDGLLAACKKNNLAWIPVLSPLATSARIAELEPHASGFWYAVSRTGTTGTESKFGGNLEQQASTIRQYSDLPIAFAFGVKSSADVQQIAQHGDMAVVGSAVQQIFLSENNWSEQLATAQKLIQELKQ